MAALLVMIFHFLSYGPPSALAGTVRLLSLMPLLDMFLIVSGFLIMERYSDRLLVERNSYWQFLLRRVVRIYPLYAATLVYFVGIGMLVHFGVVTSHSPGRYDFAALPANILLVQGWGFTEELTFNYVGYDLAIRIAELGDSSLVARKLAPVRRVLCATPDYIFAHGMPESVEDLRHHLCLRPHNNDVWKLEGPRGAVTYRPQERLITNSSEVIREAVLAGMGIALRSTWDIGPELKSGRLVRVLPELESSRNVAVFAVYPSRQFLPAKVRLFIDYLSALYSPVPNWER